MYAHSLANRAKTDWEPLQVHLQLVAKKCAEFASIFGWAEAARIAGLLHDLGKCSVEFQTYISQSTEGGKLRGPDHSTAGAREARRAFDDKLGTWLAFVIAGHHAGLANGEDLLRRLEKEPPDYTGWQAFVGPLPPLATLLPTRKLQLHNEPGFTCAFLIRMLFSCLIDADRLETAEFYARSNQQPAERVDGTPLAILRDRLKNFMTNKGAAAQHNANTKTQRQLATLRSQILAHAVEKARLAPGLFTLTVPTGGGKTLASLSFALEHAVARGLRRVIYVIPFTSIIEQTAAVFCTALGVSPDTPNTEDVLEHHASFDWEAASHKARAGGEDGRGTNPAERLQRATENWDAPIIVTTAVQFFESLFANKPSACRKLHNLAGSVIVLDEAQTLPLHILRPCLATLDELARNYGASIVICTATQPAWRQIDGKLVEKTGKKRNFGLDISPERELAPDPGHLFSALKRVEVEHKRDLIDDDIIKTRFAEQPQMLCIVNSRRHAKRLFEQIKDLPGAIHLSTWMCPKHRRLVLEQARADLKAGRAVRIVSTSLIEAGVDIDLPEVWRAAAGLDSLLQAAGRCNREFTQSAGRLVIFTPIDDRPPHDLKQAWEAGRTVLRRSDDPQTLGAIRDYFGELYLNKGVEAFDASRLDREIWPILLHIHERAKSMEFPFDSIAKAFHVIEDTMEPVIVPWSSGLEDTEAATLLKHISDMDKPLRNDLRRLQQYTVSVPQKQRNAWLAANVLVPVHPVLGDAMLRFHDDSLYDPRSGLRVDEPELRSPAANIV